MEIELYRDEHIRVYALKEKREYLTSLRQHSNLWLPEESDAGGVREDGPEEYYVKHRNVFLEYLTPEKGPLKYAPDRYPTHVAILTIQGYQAHFGKSIVLTEELFKRFRLVIEHETNLVFTGSSLNTQFHKSPFTIYLPNGMLMTTGQVNYRPLELLMTGEITVVRNSRRYGFAITARHGAALSPFDINGENGERIKHEILSHIKLIFPEWAANTKLTLRTSNPYSATGQRIAHTLWADGVGPENAIHDVNQVTARAIADDPKVWSAN